MLCMLKFLKLRNAFDKFFSINRVIQEEGSLYKSYKADDPVSFRKMHLLKLCFNLCEFDSFLWVLHYSFFCDVIVGVNSPDFDSKFKKYQHKLHLSNYSKKSSCNKSLEELRTNSYRWNKNLGLLTYRKMLNNSSKSFLLEKISKETNSYILYSGCL